VARELGDIQNLAGRSLGFCLLALDGKRGGSACYDALRLGRIAAEVTDELSQDVSVATC
jgi:hypothetical protein